MSIFEQYPDWKQRLTSVCKDPSLCLSVGGFNKIHLHKLADNAGFPTSGTRQDLINRICNYYLGGAPAPTPTPTPTKIKAILKAQPPSVTPSQPQQPVQPPVTTIDPVYLAMKGIFDSMTLDEIINSRKISPQFRDHADVYLRSLYRTLTRRYALDLPIQKIISRIRIHKHMPTLHRIKAIMDAIYIVRPGMERFGKLLLPQIPPAVLAEMQSIDIKDLAADWKKIDQDTMWDIIKELNIHTPPAWRFLPEMIRYVFDHDNGLYKTIKYLINGNAYYEKILRTEKGITMKGLPTKRSKKHTVRSR